MNEVSYRSEADALFIQLNGRVDSHNAAHVEEAILDIRKQHAGGRMVLDTQKLDYISSAGLRVVLRLRKNEKDLKIINASAAIYEILEMTGFTEMLPVEKAYRRLSVEGCEVIGQGANGKVYRLDPDTIIKVYMNPDSLPDIHRERELARKAFILGIPTAIPYDVVQVGDGYGSVFELLNATSFSKLLAKNPEKLPEYAALYVDLMKKLHETMVKPGDMPPIRLEGEKWVQGVKDALPAQQWEKLAQLIQSIPDLPTMVHGDYHTKNIMMQNDEVLLIDMDTISTGHPIYELQAMYLAYIGYGEQDHSITENFLGLSYDTTCAFWKTVLSLYLDTQDEARIQEVEDKAKLLAYTRLLRRTLHRKEAETEAGRKRVALCKQNIETLLSKIDSLDF